MPILYCYVIGRSGKCLERCTLGRNDVEACNIALSSMRNENMNYFNDKNFQALKISLTDLVNKLNYMHKHNNGYFVSRVTADHIEANMLAFTDKHQDAYWKISETEIR